jgi:hypothetical protein
MDRSADEMKPGAFSRQKRSGDSVAGSFAPLSASLSRVRDLLKKARPFLAALAAPRARPSKDEIL